MRRRGAGCAGGRWRLKQLAWHGTWGGGVCLYPCSCPCPITCMAQPRNSPPPRMHARGSRSTWDKVGRTEKDKGMFSCWQHGVEHGCELECLRGSLLAVTHGGGFFVIRDVLQCWGAGGQRSGAPKSHRQPALQQSSRCWQVRTRPGAWAENP